MDRLDNEELKEWSQNQPLSILRLDPIDRAILKISGTEMSSFFYTISDSLSSALPSGQQRKVLKKYDGNTKK